MLGLYGGGVILGPDCLVVVPGAGVAETRRAWLERCQGDLDFARSGQICQLVCCAMLCCTDVGCCVGTGVG